MRALINTAILAGGVLCAVPSHAQYQLNHSEPNGVVSEIVGVLGYSFSSMFGEEVPPYTISKPPFDGPTLRFPNLPIPDQIRPRDVDFIDRGPGRLTIRIPGLQIPGAPSWAVPETYYITCDGHGNCTLRAFPYGDLCTGIRQRDGSIAVSCPLAPNIAFSIKFEANEICLKETSSVDYECFPLSSLPCDILQFFQNVFPMFPICPPHTAPTSAAADLWLPCGCSLRNDL